MTSGEKWFGHCDDIMHQYTHAKKKRRPPKLYNLVM